MESNSSGIMRFEKLKSVEEVASVFRHVYREQNTPNADPKRISLNENLLTKIVNGVDDSMLRMKDRIARLNKTPRSNAVLAVEFIFTASPEAMNSISVAERRKYFIESVRWIAKKVGSENVLLACIHRDETTEHCHLVILPVPVGENSLNCRALLGGHKSRASELQDEFYAKVSSQFGFGRGNKGSRATHQSLSEYNTLVNQALPKLKAEKRELEIQCVDLENKISRGRQLLVTITFDIKKAMEEHSTAVRYCLTALKERLLARWGMTYEGNNQFKFESDNFVNEVQERPKLDYEAPRMRR
jgi:hypothetical protein